MAALSIFVLGPSTVVAEASELRKTPIVKAVQTARPSIVSIQGEKIAPSTDPLSGEESANRAVNGTGVILDPRGYIITNFHVVDGVHEIEVTLDDGLRHTAQLVARDPETDLAIIKVDAKDPLPVMPIGISSDLMIGETAIAVGNAYGYEQSVTRGIISSLHRAVQVTDAQFYADLIQTDASINPGNSGGPLLNIDGKMIGVNVAVRVGAQGIGFAIPVDKVLQVTSRLLADYNSKKVRHGLVFKPHSLEARDELVVESVEKESPAELAGFCAGDVLKSLDSVQIERLLDFQCGLLERKPGNSLELKVERDQESIALTLALGQCVSKKSDFSTWEVLGLELEAISTDQFRTRFPSQANVEGGLSVVSVRPEGPAAQLGLRTGDVLVGMHVWQTKSLENIAWILKRSNLSTFNPVRLTIIRDNEMMDGRIPIALSQNKTRR